MQEEMGIMKEKIVGLEEDGASKQETIDRLDQRIHALENPRRSKRLKAGLLKKMQKK